VLKNASSLLKDLDRELKSPGSGDAQTARPSLLDGPAKAPIPVEVHQPDPGASEALIAMVRPLARKPSASVFWRKSREPDRRLRSESFHDGCRRPRSSFAGWETRSKPRRSNGVTRMRRSRSRLLLPQWPKMPASKSVRNNRQCRRVQSWHNARKQRHATDG
jgi:hypothetical protein